MPRRPSPWRAAAIFALTFTVVPAAGAAASAWDTMFNPPSRQDSAMRPYKGRPRANVPIAFARVVLDEQRTYVYNARKRLIATLPSSTGLWDSTPPGYFRVFSKSAQTYYTPNPGERMKWMVRFTKGRQGGNIGFHGIPYTVKDGREVPFPTPLGEKPASHGCVRLATQDAEWLFRNMSVGATVTVVRSRG
ncbi:MAG: L,D-transpeptidase [Ilumatobacteraceae bacterium]